MGELPSCFVRVETALCVIVSEMTHFGIEVSNEEEGGTFSLERLDKTV